MNLPLPLRGRVRVGGLDVIDAAYLT